jgi:nicotinamide-nucleotide amidase
MKLELLVTGDEILRGTIADTNSPYLLARLEERGLRAERVVSVGDVREDFLAAIRAASERADACVVSGGLGPTEDDLTVDVASELLGVKPAVHTPSLDRLRARWAERRRNEPMPANAERMARAPEGAEVILNPAGVAPAFALTLGRCWFVFLPGVPKEYRALVDDVVLPRLSARAGVSPTHARVLRLFGPAESQVQERLEGFSQAHPSLRVGYRPTYPEIHISLVAPTADALAAAEAEARARLGPWVYGADADRFPAVVGAALRERRETLAVGESCTGGLIAKLVTDVAGSSDYFLSGAVVYANAAKQALLSVPEELLARHGAVSAEVALALAHGARGAAGATWGIGVTGIAGPGGGTPEKPVGLVHLAVAGASGYERAVERRFFGDRGEVRLVAAYSALDLLRKALR